MNEIFIWYLSAGLLFLLVAFYYLTQVIPEKFTDYLDYSLPANLKPTVVYPSVWKETNVSCLDDSNLNLTLRPEPTSTPSQPVNNKSKPANEPSYPFLNDLVLTRQNPPFFPNHQQPTNNNQPTNTPSNPVYPNNAPPNPVYPNNTPPNPVYPNNVPPNLVYPNNTPPNPVYPNNTLPNPVYPNNTPPNPVYPNNTLPNPVYPNNAPPNPVYPNNAPPNPIYPNNTTSNPVYPNSTTPNYNPLPNTSQSTTGNRPGLVEEAPLIPSLFRKNTVNESQPIYYSPLNEILPVYLANSRPSLPVFPQMQTPFQQEMLKSTATPVILSSMVEMTPPVASTELEELRQTMINNLTKLDAIITQPPTQSPPTVTQINIYDYPGSTNQTVDRLSTALNQINRPGEVRPPQAVNNPAENNQNLTGNTNLAPTNVQPTTNLVASPATTTLTAPAAPATPTAPTATAATRPISSPPVAVRRSLLNNSFPSSGYPANFIRPTTTTTPITSV